MKRFDRKFGENFVSELPTQPAVYLYKDEAGEVIYVGKAKNVRRRLGNYRNASRKRVHRKMREIVKAASTLEVRLQPSEEEALVVEGRLIRRLKPTFNVAGKYSFLYPAIGLVRTTTDTRLCFATDTEAWSGHSFEWYGTFSSRPRAKEAFDVLIETLALVGHLEKTSSLGPLPDVVGSRIAGVRRLAKPVFVALELYLAGRSPRLLSLLAVALLEKPRARREASWVQALLRHLRDFYEGDLAPLRAALERSGDEGSFVPQDERDTLFIRHGTQTSM
ncbi:MAG: nucleotide excision repair endonuclease [Polyangiales bacterium]